MRATMETLKGEYERYRLLAEGALEQLQDDELALAAVDQDNSVAVIVRHVAGNLASRFTDFLTSDGEKPWRDRESEFERRPATRTELMEGWARGWRILYAALDSMTDGDLDKTVTIRGQPLTVREALHRSLAHTSYHVGQVVYLAKSRRGPAWRYLSVPPGRSSAYNRNPVHEKAPRVAAAAAKEMADRLERSITGPMWHGPSLGEICKGMTVAEACTHPIASAHSIAELIRHIAAWADFVGQRLRGEEAPRMADDVNWSRGDPSDEQGMREQWARLEGAYRTLAAGVRTLTEAELSAVVKGSSHTVADMVQGVVEHGAYHGGQIALLLRAQRAPGIARG
jgi:uncharacterized damage-inducible protein DinB